jgi:predicted aspartyl protease
MTYSMKSENKLEGALNFRAWKTRIDLILAKNKVLDIVKGNIMEPQFEAGKEKEPQNVAALEKFKDNDINAMSIIVDSVKDHLIPYISHLDSSKKMYDALTNLFSVRNIGQVMSLKNELRDTKMTKDDTIASYFVRISQLRDQLQAIEEAIPEKEVVNITLNGLSRSWDAFVASMNTRKEFPTLEELWTCCAQEETRLNSKGKPQKEEDAQAFATKFKRHGGKKRYDSRKKFKRDMSKVQCFECHDYGHYKRNCPKLTRKRKERHHASTANDEEPSKKTKHDEADFFYYSALTGAIEDDMWLIDSGASRHMTGDRKNFSSMKEKETPHKVELGDNNSYAVKGIGQATIKMESCNSIHLSNVLYVPGLKKNLVSISCLEEKGDRVAFVDGKVLVWSKDSKIENTRVIGTREGRLYKLLGQNTQALVHDEINPSELWHRRYAHLHYQALPSLKQMVVGIPKLQSVHEGVCKRMCTWEEH